jgi:hypothetical protein
MNLDNIDENHCLVEVIAFCENMILKSCSWKKPMVMQKKYRRQAIGITNNNTIKLIASVMFLLARSRV